MSMYENFKAFCENITLDNYDSMKTSAGEITKKLNKTYYGLDKDDTSHLYIVGSVGRCTAIKGSSDLDILFELPDSVLKKFNGYKLNGQSALLQEVKSVLLERYPKTRISGDGQVVVIDFERYTVELVPGFIQSNNSFKYPDTHDGGSWKITNPLPEQKSCKFCNELSGGVFFDCCHMIRSWKNTQGIQLSGLLIDTLVYNHFSEHGNYIGYDYGEYYHILVNLLRYIANQDKDQVYWGAVGSNQHVKNTGDGEFIEKASGALDELVLSSIENRDSVLRNLLGRAFPVPQDTSACSAKFSTFHNTEQFIDDLMPVDIKYILSIDCEIMQNGFRNKLLSVILKEHSWLMQKTKLTFYICKTNCPKPYDIYWKVRNIGREAENRDQIRGQIYKTNHAKHHERTLFYGPHYVECYLVKNNVCVAKAHIDVPIGND